MNNNRILPHLSLLFCEDHYSHINLNTFTPSKFVPPFCSRPSKKKVKAIEHLANCPQDSNCHPACHWKEVL